MRLQFFPSPRGGRSRFAAFSGGAQQPIFRVWLADRRVARVVTPRQLPQSNVTEYSLSGLAPGDVPIAPVDHRNADIYALDVDLP